MGQRASLEISQQNRNSRSPRWGSFRASSSGGLEVGDNDRDLSLLLDHYRQELRALKVKGEKDANSRDNELEQLETVLYEKRLDLHRLGEEAKSYVTFWEYVKVIQKAAVETASTTASRPKSSSPSPDSSRKKKRHSTPSQTNTSPKKSTKNSKKSKRNTTTAIVPVSVVASFTVFSFFEAYLLKRIHLAVLLSNQKEMQQKGWNDVIPFFFDQIPKNKKQAKNTKSLLENIQNKAALYKTELHKTIEHLLYLQEIMISRLLPMIDDIEEDEDDTDTQQQRDTDTDDDTENLDSSQERGLRALLRKRNGRKRAVNREKGAPINKEMPSSIVDENQSYASESDFETDVESETDSTIEQRTRDEHDTPQHEQMENVPTTMEKRILEEREREVAQKIVSV